MKIKFLDEWVGTHFSEHMDKIHRYSERVLYLILVTGILSLLYSVLIPTGMFEHTENTILDILIKERATGENIRLIQTPASEDIVFLAIDNPTLAYGRENPEIGIAEKRVLPRRYLAKIIDYLQDQGAKAIVFDVEFKGSQGPENDIPLAKAMSKIPDDQLFLALRTDALLSKNLDSLEEISRPNRLFLLKNLIYPQLILPYKRIHDVLNKASSISSASSKRKPYLVPTLFIVNSFYTIPNVYPYPKRLYPYAESLYPYPETYLLKEIPHVPSAPAPHDTESKKFKAKRKKDKIPGGNDLYAFITKYHYQQQVCLKGSYQSQYPNNPDYLNLLKNNALEIKTPLSIDPWHESSYSYCWADAIEKTLQKSGFKIGVTSVEYDGDQFDRKTPLLYKLYGDAPYTYLGVRTALSILKPEKTILTPNYFQINHRKIPLIHRASTIINWRSAERLTQNLHLRGNLEHYYKAHLLFPYARLNAVLPLAFQINLLPFAEHALLPKTHEMLYSPQKLLNFWSEINTPWQNSGGTALNSNVTSINQYQKFYRRIYNDNSLWAMNPLAMETQLQKTESELAGGHLYRKISVSQVLREIGLKGQHAINQDRQFLENQGVKKKIYRTANNPLSGNFSFKDKIVIYGDSLNDIHRTPMGVIYGPEVVATVTDMILHDKIFVQFTPLPITIIIVLLFSFLASFFPLTFEDLPIALGAGIFVAIAYWVLSLAVFMFLGYYTPFILPGLCMIMALTGSTLWRYVVLDKESRDLTQAFGRYVSPQLMDEIQSNPAEAMENLKGRKKDLTVLFCDLKGFTKTFENADPEVMVEQLNEYFDVMTNIILDNKGTYDKYMGDAIMAFFGAPSDFEDHAFYAAKSAVEMCDALIDLNKKWTKEGRTELGLGVGLSTGEMFVGNFGSERVKNFTVMGNAVNLGARLEAYTRQAGMDIVISKETMEQCGNMISVSPLGHIEVKGFSQPVEVYGLIDLSEEAKMAYYEGYSDFYSSEY